jgi:hypothetical protein
MTMSTAKTESTTKPMLATRDFTDAGTGKSFASGKAVEGDDGTLANYAAAGLVSAEKPQA